MPEQGLATPATEVAGLENKLWIFGHSRWQGRPGVFFGLQDITFGDELFVDATDRVTGDQVTHQRFVVDAVYLADIPSGEKLITASDPSQIPAAPIVILQTSVREDGPGKQWILNQQKILAAAKNLVEGDLNDPCKYLLLFVTAHGA